MVKRRVLPLTDDAYERAVAEGRRSAAAPTAVVRAEVLPIRKSTFLELRLELRNGASLTIPVSAIDELAKFPPAKVLSMRVDPAGEGLLWDDLDVAISAPGLINQFFGYATRARIARSGGSSKSPAKVAASRKNGVKGGRKKTVRK